MSEKRFFFNGIDGATGRYLLPPMSPAEVLDLAVREKPDSVLLKLLKERVDCENAAYQEKKRIVEGNAKNLAETGWGVIFAPNVSMRVRNELAPLLDLRRDQAIQDGKPDYYQEFDYRPGETAKSFLLRHGVRPDAAADPDRGVPYYLLLVADPESLPYRFQYELDVNYGVGRIYFEKPEHYRKYAESVVAAETRPRLSRQVSFFGVKNEDDRSTRQTTEGLIEPLARGLLGPKMEWKFDKWVGPQATREQLARLLGGKETPALLFTASHGLGFPSTDNRQVARQGGLICQDWPGPRSEEGLLREHYFIAEDLADDAKVQGMMAFLFACYSAGTPDRDSYYVRDNLGDAPRLAQQPFVSRLCQRLLSHPNGGALAVVGHVDRAWTSSFVGTDKGEGADNYRNCLRRLLDGHRVGWAMEHLNLAHATLATKLASLLEDKHNLEEEDLESFADTWLESNDARNFVVFGDPAVKLAVGREIRSPVRPGGVEDLHAGGTGSARKANSDMPPPYVPPDRSARPLSVSEPPGADPERVGTEKQRLRFASYYPSQISPGSWSTLLAYFGSENSLERAEEDSKRRLESAKMRLSRRSRGGASRSVRPGQRITIIPELPGCRFNPPWVSIDWLEDFHCAEFRLQLQEESPDALEGHNLAGSVGYYVGPILLGEVRLLIGTGPQLEEAALPFEKALANPYESIFISYSRKDSALVAAFEKAYRALGFELIRDVNFIRSGEDWGERLREGIESANIFQLYWSHFSKSSEQVKREWLYALDLKRDHFIRPVYWEEPLPKPPRALAKIQFHRIVL